LSPFVSLPSGLLLGLSPGRFLGFETGLLCCFRSNPNFGLGPLAFFCFSPGLLFRLTMGLFFSFPRRLLRGDPGPFLFLAT
jgi:hypothetical protein